MVKRTCHPLSFSAVDGAVALCLAVFCMLPEHLSLARFSTLLSTRVRIVDAVFAGAFICAWHYCFCVLKLYDKFATIPSRVGATLKGVFIMTLPLVLYLHAFHPRDLAFRGFLLTLLVLFFYEIGRIYLSVYLLDQIAARDPRRAIIVGSGRRAGKAWRAVRTRYHSSIKLLGFVDDRALDDMAPEVANRYLGSLDELSNLLLKDVVDLVLIAMPIRSCYPLMQRAVHEAESAGAQVVYLGDIYDTRMRDQDPHQAIFQELAPKQDHYLMFMAAKRLLDIVGAAFSLILFSPLMVCIAIAVKLTSNGPVLYQQERYGFRRRRFVMMKFRSMVDGAEAMLPDLEHANEAAGPIFKMRNDPRVTKIGRILRETSLDELPQLWNVLRGDMSLVGPRPMSVRDVSLFSETALMRRFSVKPGMTGLWQVSGRSHVGFDEWMIMDNRYIDGWSLTLDLKILARTVGAVIRRSGAM